MDLHVTGLRAHECPQVGALPCEELSTVYGESGASCHRAFTGHDADQLRVLVGERLLGLSRH